jgi:hypothetical protein
VVVVASLSPRYITDHQAVQHKHVRVTQAATGLLTDCGRIADNDNAPKFWCIDFAIFAPQGTLQACNPCCGSTRM